jgi:DNA-binding response OmpR family regulator
MGSENRLHGTRKFRNSSSRPRVLIVEDDALLAMETTQILAEAGFDVTCVAGSVAKALACINSADLDGAVLDVNLGQETSEAVAHELLKRGTPFVTLSAYAREELPAVLQSAPYVTKPLLALVLIRELRRCLELD